MSRIPIEDENSYEARQQAMETAGDDWIEDLEEQERQREASLSDWTPMGQQPLDDTIVRNRVAVGETAEFIVKFTQPCFTCRKAISVGEIARGRKRERGWDLFHTSCPAA